MRKRTGSIFTAVLLGISLAFCLAPVSLAAEAGDDKTSAPPKQIVFDSDVLDGQMEIGAARADISPEESVIMGGYGIYALTKMLCRWSKGVHDPLYATALYLGKNGTSLVIVSLDLVGLSAPDAWEIRNEVASRVGVGADRIIVCSTHTHHSPDTVGLWGTVLPPESGRSEPYMDRMKQTAVETAVRAYNGRRPARLSYAVGALDEIHRNGYDSQVPDAPIDHTLTVLKAEDADGETIATLMNWGCHPTTENARNRLISSDWVGVYYRIMAERTGGIPVFVNGSIGASIQPSDPWRVKNLGSDGQGFVWAEAMGRIVADATGALLAEAAEIEADRIEAASSTITVPMDNRVYRLGYLLALIPFKVPSRGKPIDTNLTAARIGPVRFGTMPGEMAAHLGMQVREALGGRAQVLVGLGQDQLGYIIDPEQYANEIYSYEKMLCMSPELGGAVIRAHQKLRPLIDPAVANEPARAQ